MLPQCYCKNSVIMKRLVKQAIQLEVPASMSLIGLASNEASGVSNYMILFVKITSHGPSCKFVAEQPCVLCMHLAICLYCTADQFMASGWPQ